MNNICRPIILYNDFLPPEDKPHKNWDYLTFGYIDGISIGSNLFCDENAQYSLEKLWKNDIDHTSSLEEKCMEQFMYGFRYEENGNYDKIFWEEALEDNTKYPFIFVIFLHGDFSENQVNFQKRQELEQNLSELSETKVITYLTLDNSDLMMIILCNKYENGAKIVNDIHHNKGTTLLNSIGQKMTYSFTIAGIQKKFLNNPDAISKVQGQAIKQIFVYAIERYPGSVEHIIDELEDQLDIDVTKSPVLGCNDEVMVANDVPWSNFLKCFQDTFGVLNNSFKKYSDNLLNITTIIAQQQFIEEKNNSLQEKRKDKFQELYHSFCEELRKRVQYINNDNSLELRYNISKHYLYNAIHSLRKFENTPLSDYLCFSMLLPIHMVLDISESVQDRDKLYFFNDFYEFIKGLNLCVQNSVRSDRQFMQSLDFDITIYKTPVRLIAFYNAFIYYMKSFLSMLGRKEDTKHKYEFISCLGVTDNMQVQELFHNLSKNNRMFIVSIPENQAYDVKLMLIMLGHEVGHFVGNVIRNREYRYECSIKIISKIVTDYIRLTLKQDKTYGSEERKYYIQNEDYWQEFDKKLEKYLRIHMESLDNVDYLKEVVLSEWNIQTEELDNICDYLKEYKYYTYLLMNTLLEGVSLVLQKYRSDFFDYLLNMEYLYTIANGHANELNNKRILSDKIGSIIFYLFEEKMWKKETLSISSSLNKMMYFFKECEADLVAILTLDLSLEDYLYAIYKCVLDQGVNVNAMHNEVIMRAGLVACCMFYSDDNIRYFWNKEQELEEINNNSNEDIKKIKMDIVDFINCYFTEDSEQYGFKELLIEDRLSILGIFLNYDTLVYFLKYLLKCRKTFQMALEKNTSNKDECQNEVIKARKQLVDMYKFYQNYDIEKCIWIMQKYIIDYKKLIEEEINSLNESKEDKI